MDIINNIEEHFATIETTEAHNGYFIKIVDVVKLVVLGTFCGLRNVFAIHRWAKSENIEPKLKKEFGIEHIPCYYWILKLMKIVKPESMNECFMSWIRSFLPNGYEKMTISFDGKTIRSTAKMEKYENPLHVVSAHISELKITIGQIAVKHKSNEIPAMQDLLKLLNIEGCMVVADALNCQEKTAKIITEEKGADYLLCVKDNQKNLCEDLKNYFNNAELRAKMDTETQIEKNRGRLEERIAYTTSDMDWLTQKNKWGLNCFGTINRKTTYKGKTTDEWHYYISNRPLSASEMLKYSRREWCVESMHWLLDVNLDEDFCRIQDEDVQKNLNVIRKMALNCIQNYKKNTRCKNAVSNIMLDNLVNFEKLLKLMKHEN
jgi:predicted transposase YbfD/YdcC